VTFNDFYKAVRNGHCDVVPGDARLLETSRDLRDSRDCCGNDTCVRNFPLGCVLDAPLADGPAALDALLADAAGVTAQPRESQVDIFRPILAKGMVME
jgi:hypothetical protein